MPAIDKLFDQLLTRGGSDLHLSVGYPAMTRIDGELVTLGNEALDADTLSLLLDPLLLPMQREKFATEGDLDFAHAHGVRARFRANYFQKATGLAAVFRLIPTKIPSLVELGAHEAVRKLASRKAGLVLVTGPTGSGSRRRWPRWSTT